MKAIQMVLAVICGFACIAFLVTGCLWVNAEGSVIPMLIAGFAMVGSAIGTRACNGI